MAMELDTPGTHRGRQQQLKVWWCVWDLTGNREAGLYNNSLHAGAKWSFRLASRLETIALPLPMKPVSRRLQ